MKIVPPTPPFRRCHVCTKWRSTVVPLATVWMCLDCRTHHSSLVEVKEKLMAEVLLHERYRVHGAGYEEALASFRARAGNRER